MALSRSPINQNSVRIRITVILSRVNYAALLFPDFALILCGFALCRHTSLDRKVWQQVEVLVYYFLFPILLFQSIVKSPLDIANTSSLLIAGLVMGAAGIAMSYSIPFLPWIGRHVDAREHAGGAQVAFRFNSFIALAIAERIAGPPGLLMISLLIGVCVPVFNIAAVWPMARQARRGFFKELVRNPLIIGTASGLFANLLGLSIPTWLEPTVNRIGAASIALGLMAAGAGLQFGALSKSKILTGSVLTIRHFLLPLVAWALSHAFGLSSQQGSILLIFSALPTASTCYVLASRMGYNGPYVAGLVTLSTLLGPVSLTLSLSVLPGLWQN